MQVQVLLYQQNMNEWILQSTRESREFFFHKQPPLGSYNGKMSQSFGDRMRANVENFKNAARKKARKDIEAKCAVVSEMGFLNHQFEVAHENLQYYKSEAPKLGLNFLNEREFSPGRISFTLSWEHKVEGEENKKGNVGNLALECPIWADATSP